jgi:FKBP-type peptidyl-prolyl cis-trans isomerase 2
VENASKATWSVEVTRTGWSTETFEVEAESPEQAEQKALTIAPDRAFGTDDGSDCEMASATKRLRHG